MDFEYMLKIHNYSYSYSKEGHFRPKILKHARAHMLSHSDLPSIFECLFIALRTLIDTSKSASPVQRWISSFDVVVIVTQSCGICQHFV